MVDPYGRVFLLLVLPLASCLIMSLTKPNGEPDMISIINHMTLMEQTITTLQTQVQTTSTELTTVKAKLQTIEDELKSSEDDTTAVEAKLRIAEDNILILQHDLQKRPDPVEFSNMKTELESLKVVQAHVNNVTGNLEGLRQEVSVIKTKTSEDVAYQVTQRGSDSSGWTTFKFDTVDFNTGGGYNNASGMFTAPVPGTYIFWINVKCISPLTWFEVFIYKGQHLLASGYYKRDTDNDRGVASTTSVTHLDKGDQVRFTAQSTSYTIYGGGYSSYGGALLHAT